MLKPTFKNQFSEKSARQIANSRRKKTKAKKKRIISNTDTPIYNVQPKYAISTALSFCFYFFSKFNLPKINGIRMESQCFIVYVHYCTIVGKKVCRQNGNRLCNDKLNTCIYWKSLKMPEFNQPSFCHCSTL